MSGLRPLGKIEVIEKSICNCSSVFVTIAYILLCISVTRILMNTSSSLLEEMCLLLVVYLLNQGKKNMRH